MLLGSIEKENRHEVSSSAEVFQVERERKDLQNEIINGHMTGVALSIQKDIKCSIDN